MPNIISFSVVASGKPNFMNTSPNFESPMAWGSHWFPSCPGSWHPRLNEGFASWCADTQFPVPDHAGPVGAGGFGP